NDQTKIQKLHMIKPTGKILEKEMRIRDLGDYFQVETDVENEYFDSIQIKVSKDYQPLEVNFLGKIASAKFPD
ncbi:MAG: hypothetical protein IIA62_11240, partial [Nitrospinae bacterium]|nr:hypothetical protein [Nitrospinota bacterium]